MSEIIQGKEYAVKCSHCGGHAVMKEEPKTESFEDGYFVCEGLFHCRFIGPGEWFHFNEIHDDIPEGNRKDYAVMGKASKRFRVAAQKGKGMRLSPEEVEILTRYNWQTVEGE